MDLFFEYGVVENEPETSWLATAGRQRWVRKPRRAVLWDERQHRARGGGGTYQAGLFGEEAVSDHLQRAGWRLLGHRVRMRVGEIDLIVRREDTVVFAEVKVAGPGRMEVEQAVGERQRHRIRRAAVAWMCSNQHLQRGVRHYRFDVFLVRRDADGGIVRIDHVRNAF
jgi:putative endonuclease